MNLNLKHAEFTQISFTRAKNPVAVALFDISLSIEQAREMGLEWAITGSAINSDIEFVGVDRNFTDTTVTMPNGNQDGAEQTFWPNSVALKKLTRDHQSGLFTTQLRVRFAYKDHLELLDIWHRFRDADMSLSVDAKQANLDFEGGTRVEMSEDAEDEKPEEVEAVRMPRGEKRNLRKQEAVQ